jgi:hypothetical protein
MSLLCKGAWLPRASVIIMSTALALAGSPSLAQPDVPTARPAGPPRVLGPELWRGARVGMSQDDVATLFPTATPSRGELLPKGGRSALQLSTPVGGTSAITQFYFDAEGGLETVIVDPREVAAHQTEQNLAKAHALADQLTAQYAKPPTCAEQPHIAALTCSWVIGEAKAILSYRDVGGAAPSLSITYRKLQDAPAWAPRPVRKLKAR